MDSKKIKTKQFKPRETQKKPNNNSKLSAKPNANDAKPHAQGPYSTKGKAGDKPTSSAKANQNTEKVPDEKPTGSAKAKQNTAKVPDEKPTSSAKAKQNTAKVPDEKPTSSAKANQNTVKVPDEKPTSSAKAKQNTVKVPDEKPTSSAKAKQNTAQVPDEKPTSSVKANQKSEKINEAKPTVTEKSNRKREKVPLSEPLKPVADATISRAQRIKNRIGKIFSPRKRSKSGKDNQDSNMKKSASEPDLSVNARKGATKAGSANRVSRQTLPKRSTGGAQKGATSVAGTIRVSKGSFSKTTEIPILSKIANIDSDISEKTLSRDRARPHGKEFNYGSITKKTKIPKPIKFVHIESETSEETLSRDRARGKEVHYPDSTVFSFRTLLSEQICDSDDEPLNNIIPQSPQTKGRVGMFEETQQCSKIGMYEEKPHCSKTKYKAGMDEGTSQCSKTKYKAGMHEDTSQCSKTKYKPVIAEERPQCSKSKYSSGTVKQQPQSSKSKYTAKVSGENPQCSKSIKNEQTSQYSKTKHKAQEIEERPQCSKLKYVRVMDEEGPQCSKTKNLAIKTQYLVKRKGNQSSVAWLQFAPVDVTLAESSRKTTNETSNDLQKIEVNLQENKDLEVTQKQKDWISQDESSISEEYFRECVEFSKSPEGKSKCYQSELSADDESSSDTQTSSEEFTKRISNSLEDKLSYSKKNVHSASGGDLKGLQEKSFYEQDSDDTDVSYKTARSKSKSIYYDRSMQLQANSTSEEELEEINECSVSQLQQNKIIEKYEEKTQSPCRTQLFDSTSASTSRQNLSSRKDHLKSNSISVQHSQYENKILESSKSKSTPKFVLPQVDSPSNTIYEQHSRGSHSIWGEPDFNFQSTDNENSNMKQTNLVLEEQAKDAKSVGNVPDLKLEPIGAGNSSDCPECSFSKKSSLEFMEMIQEMQSASTYRATDNEREKPVPRNSFPGELVSFNSESCSFSDMLSPELIKVMKEFQSSSVYRARDSQNLPKNSAFDAKLQPAGDLNSICLPCCFMCGKLPSEQIKSKSPTEGNMLCSKEEIPINPQAENMSREQVTLKTSELKSAPKRTMTLHDKEAPIKREKLINFKEYAMSLRTQDSELISKRKPSNLELQMKLDLCLSNDNRSRNHLNLSQNSMQEDSGSPSSSQSLYPTSKDETTTLFLNDRCTPSSTFPSEISTSIKHQYMNYVTNGSSSSSYTYSTCTPSHTCSELYSKMFSFQELPFANSWIPLGNTYEDETLDRKLEKDISKFLGKGHKMKPLIKFSCFQPCQIANSRKLPLDKQLESMILNCDEPDMALLLENVILMGHSVVVNIYSNNFDQLSWMEPQPIQYENVTPEIFKMLYHWMCSRQSVIQKKHLIQLLVSSKEVGVFKLHDDLWHSLDKTPKFSEVSSFKAFLRACKFKDVPLQRACLQRISSTILPVIATKEFLHMPPKYVRLLFSKSYLAVNTEVEIFYAIVLWTNHAWRDRKEHLDFLLHCLRLHYLPLQMIEFFEMYFHALPLEVRRLVGHEIFQKLLHVEIAFRAAGNRNKTIPPPRTWGADTNCNYLYKLQSSTLNITYEEFLNYLKWIRSGKKAYWYYMALKNRIKEGKPKPDNMLDTVSPDTASQDTASPDTASSDTASPDTASLDTASSDTASSDTASPKTASPDDTQVLVKID